MRFVLICVWSRQTAILVHRTRPPTPVLVLIKIKQDTFQTKTDDRGKVTQWKNTLVGLATNNRNRDRDRRRDRLVEAKNVKGRGAKKRRTRLRISETTTAYGFEDQKQWRTNIRFSRFGPARRGKTIRDRTRVCVRVRDGRLKLIVSEINRFPRPVTVVVGLRPLFHPYIFVLFIARVLCHGEVDTCVRK